MNNLKIKFADILLVARKWSRRGNNSDFDHFQSWFPGAKLISTEQAITRPYFLLKKIANWTKQDGYTSYSFGIELAAILHMIIHRPKLVFFWFADHEYRYTWIIAKFLRIKIVGNFFFSIEEFERRIPNKKHIRHLNLVFSSGIEQSKYLQNFVEAKKIEFVPLGVDTNFFSPPIESGPRRNNLTLLHVGYNRRDFITLKNVFLKLKKIYPKLKLELVCADLVKELFDDLDSVTIHPFISDKEFLEVYQRSTILLLPLLEGGSSQTLNEAMATGIPIVTNPLPNLEDYTHGSGVLFSAQGDTDSMVKHCIDLLENPDRWESISKSVRAHALKFDFSQSQKKIHNAIKEKLNISFETITP